MFKSITDYIFGVSNPIEPTPVEKMVGNFCALVPHNVE